MDKHTYESEKQRILNDGRYPPALKEWMLDTLRELYEKEKGRGDNANPNGERNNL